MRLSRFQHGIFDYVFSLVVAGSPWLFGFAHEHLAPQIALTCGIGTAMYSALTDYEGGLLRFLPFSGHRFFDLAVAVTLGGAAWHFSMGGRAAWVFGALGAIGFIATMLTRTPRDAGMVAR
jgi:hypothetical protein